MDRPGFSRMDMILETTNDTSLNHFKYRSVHSCKTVWAILGKPTISDSNLILTKTTLFAGMTRKGKHFSEVDPRSQKSNQPMRRSSYSHSIFESFENIYFLYSGAHREVSH